MLFEPNLEQCKLNQYSILNSWKNNKDMKSALDNVISIFLIPESIQIYNNFSHKNNIEYIPKENFYEESIKLINKHYSKNENFYILYSGATSNLNKFGFSEQSYPIFLVTYEELVAHWIPLINKIDFFTLIISDTNFNTVIDISDIDNHAENPNHKDDYTVCFKTKKL